MRVAEREDDLLALELGAVADAAMRLRASS
jgi:hypothetical protein